MKIKMYFCPIIQEEKRVGIHTYISRRLDKDKKLEMRGEITSITHQTMGSRKEKFNDFFTTFSDAFDAELKMEKVSITGEFEMLERNFLRIWAKEYKKSGQLNQSVEIYKSIKDMGEKAKEITQAVEEGKKEKLKREGQTVNDEPRKTYNFESGLNNSVKEKIYNLDNLTHFTNAVEKGAQELLNKAVIIQYISNETDQNEKIVDEKIYNNCSLIGFSEEFVKEIDVDSNNNYEKEKIEINLVLLNKSEYINV